MHPTENTILWRWDLTPSAFGEHLPNGNPDGDAFTYTLNLRYPGQYYDAESGLHYNYFRDYEPATGRYVESDPIGLGGGTSTYGYSGGNALASIDPLGLNYWKGSIQLGQFGYSNRGIGVTNQGFSMNLEMPIGQCDFYGKRYRVRMKSSKDWHWGKKETFVGQGKVTLDDGNQAFEREALVGSFSLRVAKGSKTGTIVMGRNRIGNVTFPYAPQREDLVIDGTLSYFTATGFANADGVEERKCDCDQSADPGFRANGAWRQDDKY
ncbi:MAG: RHS repeat-associated core domain-containing protein [Caldilinea sp.]|nr:RHS repeat-associated core domain-containing protein [Caldilinea sp.]